MIETVFIHGTSKTPGHPMVLVVEANFELRVGDVLKWPQVGSGDRDLRVDAIDFHRQSVEALPRGHKGGLTISGGDITLIPTGLYLPKA